MTFRMGNNVIAGVNFPSLHPPLTTISCHIIWLLDSLAGTLYFCKFCKNMAVHIGAYIQSFPERLNRPNKSRGPLMKEITTY